METCTWLRRFVSLDLADDTLRDSIFYFIILFLFYYSFKIFPELQMHKMNLIGFLQ